MLGLNHVGLIKPILAANMVNNNEWEISFTQQKLIKGNVNLVQTAGTSAANKPLSHR